MSSMIETIKTKVDVVDEINLVVALHRSGKSYKGLCPFHNERTPSFYVFPETQSWHCFGCHEGGDVFAFVQKQQGLEFREALRYLAGKAGVSVDDYEETPSEADRELQAAKQRLYQLNEEAMLWFQQVLLRSKDAEVARAYVQSRGISADSIMSFGIGYALDQWDGLIHYLLSRGYSESELVSAGLARERESDESNSRNTGIYDYFRRRLIFPIRDTRGRVIGFGGRALGDGKPKYLNSPQTLLFEKNTVLYALDLAKDAIRQANQVIIVEGYVDAVIAHQYGTKQTVACIGSAITEKHIQQLKKLTKQVTLALDPDAAGNAATEHGIEEALKSFDRTVVPVPVAPGQGDSRRTRGSAKRAQQARGIILLEEKVDAEINVLQLPAGEDPDEIIKRDFSSWLYAVTHPLPLVDYFFVSRTADLNLHEPMGKAEAAKRLLPIIGTISERIKRDAYIRKLAGMISIDERTLYEELQRLLRGQKSAGTIAEFTASAGKSRAQQVHVDKKSSSIREREDGMEAHPATQSGSVTNLDRRRRDRIQWEDYLIGLLLQNPGLYRHVCVIISDGDFAGTDTRELYRLLNSVYQRDPSPSFQSIEQLVPAELLGTVQRTLKYVESRSLEDRVSLTREAVQCASRLKRKRLLQLNTELHYLLQEAEQAGEKNAQRQIRRQIYENSKQLRTLESAIHLQG